jgi:CRP-like cAMP-binding protein
MIHYRFLTGFEIQLYMLYSLYIMVIKESKMPRRYEDQEAPGLFDMRFKFITEYHKDDVIFKEGSRGREMYVIYSGGVRIVKREEEERDTVLATLEPGELFGEMALIDDEPRSATAIAVDDDTKLISLDRARFMYLLRHEPEFALIVMGTLCERVREKNVQYSNLLGES